MTLPITPTIVRAAYEFLSETPPFDKWNLPDSDDLTFRVVDDTGHYAWLTTKRGRKPVIAVSRKMVGHTVSLLQTVAHEMGHLHQYRTGMPLTHGAAWEKIKLKICNRHGFDPKHFG